MSGLRYLSQAPQDYIAFVDLDEKIFAAGSITGEVVIYNNDESVCNVVQMGGFIMDGAVSEGLVYLLMEDGVRNIKGDLMMAVTGGKNICISDGVIMVAHENGISSSDGWNDILNDVQCIEWNSGWLIAGLGDKVRIYKGKTFWREEPIGFQFAVMTKIALLSGPGAPLEFAVGGVEGKVFVSTGFIFKTNRAVLSLCSASPNNFLVTDGAVWDLNTRRRISRLPFYGSHCAFHGGLILMAICDTSAKNSLEPSQPSKLVLFHVP
ncbi:hypothetical protein DAMA08_031230 [Martiniozyma asiatica (nom. inval.)]|nr:hypothetical protein DAMA08_031230 [Martiniozyma asiatica]